jgi:predicted aspartyl protease
MPTIDCGFASQDQLVRFGPTLTVRIGFDDQFGPGRDPDLPETEYHALVDTGASLSCIDSGLAASLKLPVIDRVGVAGALGGGQVNLHLAQILIPSLQTTVYGGFAGVHLHAGGQPHSALIGRMFLKSWSMSYNGQTGSVILSHA